MAVMYPKEPPAEFPSSAEERLYYEMGRQLSDDFTVMHGVSWLDALSHYRHVEGEADFVILHEELGIIVLEVKGGRISLEDGNWFSIDRHDRTHAIKNPMKQARRSMRAILDRLERSRSVHRFLEQYNFHTGVVFPDITAPREGMGAHVPHEVIIDGSDIHTLERSLRRMVSRKRPPTRMTKPAIRAFVDLLRPSEVFDDATFATAILESGRQIEAYTESQFKVLELLRTQRRIAIPGCAGSGKTLLALRKAKHLAQNGLNVLLTCYNRPLAEWMNQQVNSDPIDGSGSVRVDHFHGLAKMLLLETGLTVPRQPSGRRASQQYFDVDLPEYLFDNTESISRFDAIVVDEGQDFSPAMWMALEALLKSPGSSTFYVFFDAEQGIYQDQAKFPVKISDIALMKNLRNTAPIHHTLIDYYAGDVRPESIGIQGLKPEIISVPPECRSREVRRIFNRLLNEENIPPDDLVMLTFAGERQQ